MKYQLPKKENKQVKLDKTYCLALWMFVLVAKTVQSKIISFLRIRTPPFHRINIPQMICSYQFKNIHITLSLENEILTQMSFFLFYKK